MSRPVAVITGASSGIGAELAKVFAARGYDLVLCARRESRLKALAEDIATQTGGAATCTVVSCNLARSKGPSKLIDSIADLGLEVDVLVNNAGVAESGRFVDMARSTTKDLLNLNVRALTELSLVFSRQMGERGKGRILNVASVVAFRPLPSLAVYAASKAYVLSLTESLAEEFRGTGVTFSALCPGVTRTEMTDDLLPEAFQGMTDVTMADAASVARAGYDACRRGEVIHVPGVFNQAFVNWGQYQPRWSYRLLSGLAARMSFAYNEETASKRG
ncbi:MAG: SDR family oxidoreductase [Pseudomonadota bacterium]